MKILAIIFLLTLFSCEKETAPCEIKQIELVGELDIYGQRAGGLGYRFMYYCEMLNKIDNTVYRTPTLLYSDSVYKKVMKFEIYDNELLIKHNKP